MGRSELRRDAVAPTRSLTADPGDDHIEEMDALGDLADARIDRDRPGSGRVASGDGAVHRRRACATGAWTTPPALARDQPRGRRFRKPAHEPVGRLVSVTLRQP